MMASTARRLKSIAIMAAILGLVKGTLFLYQGLVELPGRGWTTILSLCLGGVIALFTAFVLWRSLRRLCLFTLAACLIVVFGCYQASLGVTVDRLSTTVAVLTTVPIYILIALTLYIHAQMVDDWPG